MRQPEASRSKQQGCTPLAARLARALACFACVAGAAAGPFAVTAASVSGGSGVPGCTITANGECFRDAIGNTNYGDSERCTWYVSSSTTLHVQTFQTEQYYDYLTIRGVRYSGSSGPSGVSVFPGDVISWASDYSNTASGFCVCSSATAASTGCVAYAPTGPPAAPTVSQSPTPALKCSGGEGTWTLGGSCDNAGVASAAECDCAVRRRGGEFYEWTESEFIQWKKCEGNTGTTLSKVTVCENDADYTNVIVTVVMIVAACCVGGWLLAWHLGKKRDSRQKVAVQHVPMEILKAPAQPRGQKAPPRRPPQVRETRVQKL